MAAPLVRCINIDWLEVYALEPINTPLDESFFTQRGFIVRPRDYGTRVWGEMFTLLDTQGNPFIEIRRAPKSSDAENGILPANAAHIRFVNRYCYYDNAVQLMAEFIERYQYTFQSISRIDIALDFEKFDYGDLPATFLLRYMRKVYAKVNQANAAARWYDAWNSREYNSISWGSPQSQITTKLYNKSKELQEVKDKPYIKEAWLRAGLISNPRTGEKYVMKEGVRISTSTPAIWRLEFSIKSNVKGWFQVKLENGKNKYQSYRNTLDMYNTKEKLMHVFMSLAHHYFSFRILEEGKSKYDCKPKKLFDFSTVPEFLHVEHPASDMPQTPFLMQLERKLNKFLEHYNSNADANNACEVLLRYLSQIDYRRYLPNPYDNAALESLILELIHKGAFIDIPEVRGKIIKEVSKQLSIF